MLAFIASLSFIFFLSLSLSLFLSLSSLSKTAISHERTKDEREKTLRNILAPPTAHGRRRLERGGAAFQRTNRSAGRAGPASLEPRESTNGSAGKWGKEREKDGRNYEP